MEFHERIGRLSERERATLLRAFDSPVPKIPERAAAEVDQEIEDLRCSRRDGGRGTLADSKVKGSDDHPRYFFPD